jgi:hypothetical protein
MIANQAQRFLLPRLRLDTDNYADEQRRVIAQLLKAGVIHRHSKKNENVCGKSAFVAGPASCFQGGSRGAAPAVFRAWRSPDCAMEFIYNSINRLLTVRFQAVSLTTLSVEHSFEHSSAFLMRALISSIIVA